MLNPQAAAPYHVSDDPSWLDLPGTYEYMQANMYWAKELTFEAFVRSVRHSAVCLGVYDMTAPVGGKPRQIGFARVVSDRATFAYLTDVFIREEFRGQGLSKRLMETLLAHPDLQGLRRFLLVTEDADGLYRRYGFRGLGSEAPLWLQIFSG